MPPGITLLAFASVLSCLLPSGQAKVYSRCELFRELQDLGLEGYRGHGLADCENRSPWLALAPASAFSLLSSLLLTQGLWPRTFLNLSSHLWNEN